MRSVWPSVGDRDLDRGGGEGGNSREGPPSPRAGCAWSVVGAVRQDGHPTLAATMPWSMSQRSTGAASTTCWRSPPPQSRKRAPRGAGDRCGGRRRQRDRRSAQGFERSPAVVSRRRSRVSAWPWAARRCSTTWASPNPATSPARPTAGEATVDRCSTSLPMAPSSVP